MLLKNRRGKYNKKGVSILCSLNKLFIKTNKLGKRFFHCQVLNQITITQFPDIFVGLILSAPAVMYLNM